MRVSVLFSVALLLVFSRFSAGQDVISACSGLLQYFEGAVALDDKPVEHKTAVFPGLKNGSTLRTDKGRAELVLTPGVFLRLDDDSSVRMDANALTDTRLELTGGSILVDNLNAPADAPVVLVVRGSEVRFLKQGVYRIDYALEELQAYSGEARVTHHGQSTMVDSAHRYYFQLELTTTKSGDGDMDEFYDWAHNRSDTIASQNQMASAEQVDAQDPDPAAGMFVMPPIYSMPGYAGSSTGYSLYSGSVTPFYASPALQNFGYTPFTTIFVFGIGPLRGRPVGSKWPVSIGAVYRPTPTRWPGASVNGGITAYSPGGLHYPLGGSGSSLFKPPTVTAPRVMAPRLTTPAIPHPAVAAPHVGLSGHR